MEATKAQMRDGRSRVGPGQRGAPGSKAESQACRKMVEGQKGKAGAGGAGAPCLCGLELYADGRAGKEERKERGRKDSRKRKRKRAGCQEGSGRDGQWERPRGGRVAPFTEPT